MKPSTDLQEDHLARAPQAKLGVILLLFAWPAAWYTLLIYGLGRQLIPAGGVTPTWVRLLVVALGGGLELTVGLILLRREGRRLTLASLRERIHWRWPKGWKTWSIALITFLVGMSLSMMMEPANRALASLPGFEPPAWWGPVSNPLVKVNGVAEAFPDVSLEGNYLFGLLYFAIGLVCNIFGEEIYYRGYLLPRMRGVFGKWDWIANGVLFTLKHVYQRWLFPAMLVGGLGFAFGAGPLGSLPLAMVYHWAGNFLFPMFFLVVAISGAG